MSDTSNEGRKQSIHGIQNEHTWSNETQKVYSCINDSWILDQYVRAMKNNGNLTAEQLAEFFYFAAETMDEINREFEDVDIDKIDWNGLTKVYAEA